MHPFLGSDDRCTRDTPSSAEQLTWLCPNGTSEVNRVPAFDLAYHRHCSTTSGALEEIRPLRRLPRQMFGHIYASRLRHDVE